MIYGEANEQEKVVTIARYMAKDTKNYPFLSRLHSSLNASARTPQQGARFKRQGMLAGVPDLFLPVPKNGYHGLYIEMKYGKGKPTESQKQFIEDSLSLGYQAIVCYSAKEAIQAIEDYYK
jgi:hypothetical protein